MIEVTEEGEDKKGENVVVETKRLGVSIAAICLGCKFERRVFLRGKIGGLKGLLG